MSLFTVVEWLFIAAFMRPAVEMIMLIVSEVHCHLMAATRRTDQYKTMIVQITTVGKEYARVNEIIDVIRSYNLDFIEAIWIVNEPGQADTDNGGYPGADRVITVPEDFVDCASAYKARGLEYSRRLRRDEGIVSPSRKMVFLDDDVEPTRRYLVAALKANYDICQGITAPRLHYGRVSAQHWLLSHLDDMRFAACLVYCSFSQGLIKHPMFAHGEGMVVTTEAEQLITWNYPIYASEDLVFGQNAVRLGLKWGFFHEYIQLTSPWTMRDFTTQRRRWTWGNVRAVRVPGILPTWGRIVVAARYILGPLTFAISTTGMVCAYLGVFVVSDLTLGLFLASKFCWLSIFAFSGWVNSYRDDQPKNVMFWANRLWQAFSSVLLAVTLVTPALICYVLLRGLLQGDPKGFEMIAKTVETVNAESELEVAQPQHASLYLVKEAAEEIA
jgi:hypothetical protein